MPREVLTLNAVYIYDCRVVPGSQFLYVGIHEGGLFVDTVCGGEVVAMWQRDNDQLGVGWLGCHVSL